VLSAPSGTGKDSVINALKERKLDFHVVPSVSTRAMRPGESEGNPYHFVSEARFEQMVQQDELLEYAKVHGNWYGQPRQDIREHLQAGRDVLLKIDVQGGKTVKRKVPDAIFIFLVPGSVEELVQRLTNRQTETEAEQALRLRDAQYELDQRAHYHYIVENRQGLLEDAVENVRAIILAERCRTNPHYVQL
jgi:guanylate kinase